MQIEKANMGNQGKRKGPRGGGGADMKKLRRVDPDKVQGLPSGTRGVLVSCVVGKETLAGQEAVAVLSEAYEALVPQVASADQFEESEPKGDISAALAAEVADLKDHKKQPFYYTTLGCPGISYVEVRYCDDGPQPSTLVEHACREAKNSRQNKTRLCHRFYPIDYMCKSTLEDMGKLATAVITEHFPEDAEDKGVTFSVEYDKRAAPSNLTRDAVIDAWAKKVNGPYKVNLTAPQRSILVNVMKDTCGVAVVKDYKDLGKFNLTALATAEVKDA